MYRYAAYEMLHRLKLENVFNKVKNDPFKSRQKRILSKALWGLFCFEKLAIHQSFKLDSDRWLLTASFHSIVGYVYLELSLLKPPSIPRCFESPSSDHGGSSATAHNIDLFGNRYETGSRPPPFVPGVLYAACDLSELLYQSMLWNAEASEVGSPQDLKKRTNLHTNVLEWRNQLPKYLKEDCNFTPQTCFLR